jgi:hypothetical protein
MLDSFLARISALGGGVGLLIVVATVPLGSWQVPILVLAMVLTGGGVLAVALHAGRSVWRWTRVRANRGGIPDLAVEPTGGPSQDLRLMVTNLGRLASLQGTAVVTATRNYPNRHRLGTYTLMWLGRGSNTIPLDRGQSEALLVARWKIHDGPVPRLAQVALVECHGSAEAEWDGFRWNMEPNEKLPEFDVDISIAGSGFSEPFRRSYTLRPSSWLGPLELFEAAPRRDDLS